MPGAQCPQCGSSRTEAYDNAVTCADCGCVLEESQIVSDITFGETGSGGAVVQGSYVANDSRGARTQGPGGFRSGGTGESRAMTIANAQRGIRALATAKSVPSIVADIGTRLFQLAIGGGTIKDDGEQPANFVLGRRSEYSQAACLYLACRMQKTNHMLIDFADALQINVFILGRSYLRLVRCLGFQQKVPVMDPSIYISRFASMLDFGDATSKVAADATRLVRRFKKDWLVEGRRPAGICGACLLLAARMNHFRRSITEVVQVVKIADQTLRMRLQEFARTPTANLSVEDFSNIWLEEETEPPAFVRSKLPKKTARLKGRKRAKLETAASDDDLDAADAVDALDDPTTDEDSSTDSEAGSAAGSPNGKGKGRATKQQSPAPTLDPTIDAMADTATQNEILRHLDEDVARELDGELSREEAARQERARNGDVGRASPDPPRDDEAGPSRIKQSESQLQGRDSAAAEGNDGAAAVEPDEGARVYKRGPSVPAFDELAGLDEAELDNFILTPEEARIKERVWMQFNKDYLELSLERQLKMEADIKMGIQPKRAPNRKRKQPRDSSTAAVSAAESTKQMMKKKQFSRKINYDALGDIFKNEEEVKQATGGSSRGRSRKRGRHGGDETSDGDDMGGVRGYFQSDADESEMEVVEEAEGQLPSSHPSRRQESRAMRKHRAKAARSQSRGSATGDAMSSAGEEALSTRTSPGPDTDGGDDALAEMRRMRGAQHDDGDDDGYQDAGY